MSKALTAALGVLLLLVACTLTSPVRFWWRALAINFIPVVAVGFMAAALLWDGRFSGADVASALVFEFAVLCVFCRVAYLSYAYVHLIERSVAARALVGAIAIYLAVTIPTALGGGFGIFADGNRLAYLAESSSAKYLTYAGVLIGLVLAGLIGRRISLNRRPLLLDFVVIGAYSILSIVAGSKGGFLLWLGAILGFINYREARIRVTTIIISLVVVAGLTIALAVVVSNFLRLTIPEFFDLAFNRIFITNDARAMAFDFRRLDVDPTTTVFAESFRSVATLFGSPPSNAPLGTVLYDTLYGPLGGVGANTSLTALIVYYSAPDYTVLLFAVALAALFFLYLSIDFLFQNMKSSLSRFVNAALATIDVTLLSQDFLAFQVVVPLSIIVAVLLYAAETVQAGRSELRRAAN